MAYPYYGTYMPNYYQPMQNAIQPMMNQPQGQTQQMQNMPQTGAQSNFFCRPVASKEEALGVPVDFMGAPMFFPDLAHNVIYMKRFNTNTGAADIFEFRTQAQEQQSTQAPAFVSIDEFSEVKDTVNRMKDEIERLKKPVVRVKKNDSDE